MDSLFAPNFSLFEWHRIAADCHGTILKASTLNTWTDRQSFQSTMPQDAAKVGNFTQAASTREG
jgi:hypothetical protein